MICCSMRSVPPKWLLAIAAVCLVGASVMLSTGPGLQAAPQREEAALNVTATLEGPLLRVHWEKNDPLITTADRVEVRSTDGGLTEFKNLFGAELRAGGFDYYLRSDDAVLEIRAELQGRTAGRAFVRYFAVPKSVAAPAEP